MSAQPVDPEDFLPDHDPCESQDPFAGQEPEHPASQKKRDSHPGPAGGDQVSAGTATGTTSPKIGSPPLLDDPTLQMCADVVDDLEKVRIANENRLRQLIRGGWDDPRITSGKYKSPDELPPDADGNERGFGLDESHPDVARLAALVQGLAGLEHDAILSLQRSMRKHPLGPWVKAQKSVGDKQAARLLATIGDPYIHGLTGEPRTVSQLWAYCGLHSLPASQPKDDTHDAVAGGDHTGGNIGQVRDDTQSRNAYVAAKRAKGQKANWSADAKMRAWNIAGSCVKGIDKSCKTEDGYVHAEECNCSPYRLVYDARKTATEGRAHAATCVRCGPSGKPALAGSPWSDAHRHADALRIVSKELLKDLWKAARDIHNQ